MVTALSRGAWQTTSQPVTGPARRQPFRQGIVHWEGVERDFTPNDIGAYLRTLQAIYLRERDYSLGYGYAVVSDSRHPMDGTRWEIRGTDINMASNNGEKWNTEGRSPQGNVNDWTGSVLLIGPTGVRTSTKAALSVRTIFSEWHAEANTPLSRPWPHSTTDYTTCCGPAFTADIAAGVFDPAPVIAPPVTVPSPVLEGAPAMFIFVVTNAPGAAHKETWLLVDGTQMSHIVNGHAAEVFTDAKLSTPVIYAKNAEQTAGVIASVKTMNDCPPEWVGTGWETAWNGQR